MSRFGKKQEDQLRYKNAKLERLVEGLQRDRAVYKMIAIHLLNTFNKEKQYKTSEALLLSLQDQNIIIEKDEKTDMIILSVEENKHGKDEILNE